MATTTATISITSPDLTPGMPLAINPPSTTINQTGLATGLELVDVGAGKLTETSAADALHEALGTADTSNWVYLCNNSTDINQYIKIGIHETVIGNLGAGEFLWMPWNMGDADEAITIEAEPSGTIPSALDIFTSTYTLPAKTSQ